MSPADPSDPESCLLWTGARQKNGYGKFSYKGTTELAHRVAFVLTHNRLPEELDHICNNRPCVSPSHLIETDHRENLMNADGFAAANAEKQFCPYGHEYTPENTYTNGQRGRKCSTCVRKRQREYEYNQGRRCRVCRVEINNRSRYCKSHKQKGEGRPKTRRRD